MFIILGIKKEVLSSRERCIVPICSLKKKEISGYALMTPQTSIYLSLNEEKKKFKSLRISRLSGITL